MRRSSFILAVLLAGGGIGVLHAAPDRPVPHWASISAGQARMRTGPGRNFPASWLYQRADLPVKVIETYPAWRKIEDQDGTQGWMMAKLLSDRRTAVIIGERSALHASPEASAPVAWRAEPGVVGRISHCANGWCEFEVKGRTGYVETAHIWGVAADETIE